MNEDISESDPNLRQGLLILLEEKRVLVRRVDLLCKVVSVSYVLLITTLIAMSLSRCMSMILPSLQVAVLISAFIMCFSESQFRRMSILPIKCIVALVLITNFNGLELVLRTVLGLNAPAVQVDADLHVRTVVSITLCMVLIPTTHLFITMVCYEAEFPFHTVTTFLKPFFFTITVAAIGIVCSVVEQKIALDGSESNKVKLVSDPCRFGYLSYVPAEL